jgi:hypothetical protein
MTTRGGGGFGSGGFGNWGGFGIAGFGGGGLWAAGGFPLPADAPVTVTRRAINTRRQRKAHAMSDLLPTTVRLSPSCGERRASREGKRSTKSYSIYNVD